MIEAQNISKRYGEILAVNDVSFVAEAGDVVGFLGPNGAGKTTTMRILTGFLPATDGTAIVDGHDIFAEPLAARRAVGYLPETPPLYPEMDVRGYLTYVAKLKDVPRAKRRDAVDRATERCGLAEVRRRVIGSLSKGYRQRVGIAQAIVHDPSVLILDEPTVGLDPIQIREIRELIRGLGSERSVILSTHILSEVQATCHRVQIIRAGELIYNASIESLNQGHDSSFAIALRNPVAADELAAVDGVDLVEPLEDGRYRVFIAPGASPDQLVTSSVENDWGLYELVPEQQSLEDLFIELTHNEQASAP